MTRTAQLPDARPPRAAELRLAKEILFGDGIRPPVVLRGETGSGKSVLLNRLVNAAIAAGLEIRPVSELAGGSTSTPGGAAQEATTLYVSDDVESDLDLAGVTVDQLVRDERIRVLVASERATALDPFAHVIVLRPLDATSARDLVRDEAPGAPPTAVDYVVTKAEGCLALLAHGAEQLRAGWASVVRQASLDLPDQYLHLRATFLAADAETQAFLVAAAVRRDAWTAALPTPAAPTSSDLGPESQRLRTACTVETFLESVKTDTRRFRSVVHRTAVLAASSPPQLRAAHADAAADTALPQPTRSAHAAMSAEDGGAAISLWARTAAHEPACLRIFAQVGSTALVGGSDAARRLGFAVAGAAFTGDLLLVQQLISDERIDLVSDPYAMIGAALARFLAHGDVPGSTRLLDDALDQLVGSTGVVADEVALEAALVAVATVNVFARNEPGAWTAWMELAQRHPSPVVSRLRGAVARSVASPANGTDDARVEGALARMAPVEDLAEVLVGAIFPEMAWRTDALVPDDDERTMVRSRIGQSLSKLVEAAFLIRECRWIEALALLDGASQDAAISGDRVTALGADAMRSLALALQGDGEAAFAVARRVLADPMSAVLPRAAMTARHTLLHLALQRDDDGQLFAAAASAGRLAFDGGAYPALWMLDLADGAGYDGPGSARLGGRQDPLPGHIRRFTLGERLAFEYLRLERDPATELSALRRLLATTRGSGYLYEAARIQLSYGRALAAAGDTAAASTELALAEDAFDALGARDWASRAARLRETVVDRQAAEALTDDLDLPVIDVALTEQELRVAALAAAGLSNKQIAERLTVSPRTVGGHLYNIFPKLGVRSRAGLRDALTRREQRQGRLVTAS